MVYYHPCNLNKSRGRKSFYYYLPKLRLSPTPVMSSMKGDSCTGTLRLSQGVESQQSHLHIDYIKKNVLQRVLWYHDTKKVVSRYWRANNYVLLTARNLVQKKPYLIALRAFFRLAFLGFAFGGSTSEVKPNHFLIFFHNLRIVFS